MRRRLRWTVQVLHLRHLRDGRLSPVVYSTLPFGHRFGHRCLPPFPPLKIAKAGALYNDRSLALKKHIFQALE